MKELSIEEKAQHYDKAINTIRNLVKAGLIYEDAAIQVFPELKESEDERIRNFISNELACLRATEGKGSDRYKELTNAIAWLEKQGRLMKALQISNSRIAELVEEKYNLEEKLEKQGEHANFLNKIQIGDKVTRNEDGVLVNLSQLKRVAKPAEVQGEQKPVQEIEPTPIFKIGDIFKRKCKDYTFRVDRIQGGYYHCDHNHGAFFPIEEQDNWELVEQKPTDKIEPKFHKGEWIIHQGTENIYQVVAIIDNQYQLKYGDNYTTQYCEDVDRYTRLWNVAKDAKDGDVLADGNLPFIFKKIDSNKYSYAYCGISVDNGFKIESDGESGEWTWTQDIKPATKEQRDLLFQKMKEAGYTFNFEKKELKKIKRF